MFRRYIRPVVLAAIGISLGAAQIAMANELHTAQDGDTVTSIAQAHGVSADDLAAANSLDPAAELTPGQDLIVPSAANSASQLYVVEQGDTVASIATAFGVSAGDIIAANAIEDIQDLRVGVTLTIPTSSGASADLNEGSPNPSTLNAPAYKQSRSLSCEYASVYIATSIFGNPIPEADYISTTPRSANPHDGFRGDIDGTWGITDDYGIYAEALVPLLEQRGYVGEVSYDPSQERIQSNLDAGRPVIVWVATKGDTSFYADDATGRYKLVPYEHVVVIYGYDETGVFVSDPGNGLFSHYGWDWFLPAWDVMDGMALTVYPSS